MSAVPDDLEKLLSDVRKTIHENQQFLLALADDAADNATDELGKEESKEDPEEFEEL